MYACYNYGKKRCDSTEDSNNAESASSNEDQFSFPPPPRLCKSASISPCSLSYRSDSSVSDGKLVRTRRRGRRKNCKTLPPIGVFWDIENCQVPRTKSATSIVQRIRELFYDNYREAEFLVVCDVKKEVPQVIQDLNDAQVNLIHISCTSKNAADEKLRQSLRRFAELYRAPAAIALISSDVNFAADLSDLRYRKKINVILIHNNNVADALILCANETYNFGSITETIPPVLKNKRENKAAGAQYTDLCVYNLPAKVAEKSLKCRLKCLSGNCGGRVLCINKDLGTAIIRFGSHDFAQRAQKRLLGEDVFGNKIRVAHPTPIRESPSKHYTGRRVQNLDGLYQVPPIPIAQGYGHVGNSYCVGNSGAKSWTNETDQETQSGYVSSSIFRPIRGNGLMDVSSNRQPAIESIPAAVQTRPTSRTHGNTNFNNSKNGETSLNVIPAELVVSNLDSSISLKELKHILHNMIKQYAMVLNLTITTQADGCPIANVKVGNSQEAQLVISQLHHQWLGCKRMSIAYTQTSSDPDQLRFMIVSLLQEVPGNQMPLFKFFELAESRFHYSISLSEVNKLKDVCKITDEKGGRTIELTRGANFSPMNMNSTFTLYCTVHCHNGFDNRGWGEVDDIVLPNINISLKFLSAKINQLLVSHMGCVPLLSLPVCYEIEFREPLPICESGVPLEHLVTCVSNVELSYNEINKNIKYLKLKDVEKESKEPEDPLSKSVSPSLMTNIQMLCREIVDLLKTTDRCQLLLSRYIPAYHHHFGRQCRVADYGFTRLVELFEAISHVVQIIGTGTKRTILLTHSAQVRRFTSDLLRIVKVQTLYQVTAEDFPIAYERVLKKPFVPIEYGLCSLEDLLDEVPENTVTISMVKNVITIAIPKKEQTSEQIQRTKEFALEVVELLSHSVNCSMLFNKFVPAYHHHFGRQCKVSEYGFGKLAELFESISETVELEGESEVDRKVKLKPVLALKVLGSQIQKLIKDLMPLSLPVDVLPNVYKRAYGYTLKPEAYECSSVPELLFKMSDFIQVIHGDTGLLIVCTNIDNRSLGIRVWSLLLNPPHSLSMKTFIYNYRIRFLSTLPITKLQQLQNVVEFFNTGNETVLTLTKFYTLAAQFFHLLFASDGFISIIDLESMYVHKFGNAICPQHYGYNSLESLLTQMDFFIEYKENNKNVMLNTQLLNYSINLPKPFVNKPDKNQEHFDGWSQASTSRLISNIRGITPPKPDTPPPANCWNSAYWSTSPNNETNLNISIPLSSIDTSKVFMDTQDLISPTRSLLSAHTHPLNVIPKISAPHPMNLPLPDKLIAKDDSTDSGVNNSSRLDIAYDSEYLSEPVQTTGAIPRCSRSFQTFSTFH